MLKNLYAVLAVALFIKLTLIVHTHVRTTHTHIYIIYSLLFIIYRLPVIYGLVFFGVLLVFLQGWSDGPNKRVFPAKTPMPGCRTYVLPFIGRDSLGCRTYVLPFIGRDSLGCQNGFPKVNSLAPFASLYKATCGAFFDEVSLPDTATDEVNEVVHPRRGLSTRHPPTVLDLQVNRTPESMYRYIIMHFKLL